ncbi:MAG: DUF3883 domain-containing protein [Agriterribacter sp.]
MNTDWSEEEVRLIVEDYFKMLSLEIDNNQYNKSQHRRTLLPLLNERSPGAVEFKHQNISAALIKMGLPFIKGYKPLFNYQKEIIEKEISDFIKMNRLFLESEFEKFSTAKTPFTLKQTEINFENVLNDEPVSSQLEDSEPIYRPIKINYLEKEQNNRSLGEAGEEFVLNYEKWRLIKEGRNGLADKVEWISKDQGDGLGFDILSKNKNGTDRYIEVKTTKLSKETPIYLTKTELSFASTKENEFFLYRVFNFESSPELFIKNGKYENFCQLKAQTFKGFF